ncbi:pyruvate kinase [Parachlamydia sp. AcF125]|uniref:pyruvate kinase n=1 Tax=Parachlamydia sp. AcF125 TaxID=2795736 RepID=UPI001BCA1454|nr:pyruvate kinase [Parachlamydia sp. AcF125]MBS4169218.1 Pyruvate kinase [Parachlamydia sp. AcF125]
MITKTKVICTIGPSVNSLEKIQALMQAGMNVARLNFSHQTHKEHLETIQLLKQARKNLDTPLAIMLDTKGPEIRLGRIKDQEQFLKTGQRWLLVKEPIEGDINQVSITPPEIIDQLAVGMQVLFDDGYISSQVVEVTPNGVVVEIFNGGLIHSGKGMNVPNTSLNLPALTDHDIADIRFGCQQDIDIIAASFIRSADHVLTIKRLLEEEKKSSILVIAKIENSEGVQNFDSIVKVADGIMIARGDLGVEVPLSQVPRLQKMMIRKCYIAGKPSVTATQMLESMIHNPRPTRAEVSDVANAIYDSTSAVMLSGETAIGHYPIEAVAMMKEIIKETEEDFDYYRHFHQQTPYISNDVPAAVSVATVKISHNANAKAIFTFTNSGGTARLLSRLRPPMPIIALTPNEKCYHQMALNWGVIPCKEIEHVQNIQDAFKQISAFALEKNHVNHGDLVLVTAGSPFGFTGTTNMMIVESIGDVLVRGIIGFGHRVHGNVCFALTSDSKQAYEVKDKLLVITSCDESYIPLIKESLGVILENFPDNEVSEEFLKKIMESLHKPYLCQAAHATRILKEGGMVTLDPEKKIIYKGIVLN